MYGQATFDKSPKKFSKEVSFFSSSSVGAARKVSEKVNFNPLLPVPKKKMYLRWLTGLNIKA